ncbi:DUF7845 domain-containing protein [Natranaeroarchaeum sulfidigenes]|uniref:Protein containing HTH domain n=1 Tax=Natranaeroarchaeum sulfidigenes TaxID=2784880 RepID=A0A897MU15_9EURY|nr:hypothetical protein [Natranaeroarchaeum sulfidigenes]QSG02533.1 Protein containing HTH domain [Natranaeroarchaeum sulfidigenes]
MIDIDHIQPHIHEADVFLWFADHGLSPYWAIRNVLIHELDGYVKRTVDIGEDPWTISLGYSDSGIAPRDSDAVERDVLRDFELHMEGPNQAKVHYQIRARFDEMCGPDGDEKNIPWRGGEGLDVHSQPSNIPLDQIPALLRRGLDEVFDAVEDSMNPSYFRRPLPESTISTLEFYVRLRRQYAEKLIRTDGAFYRLMHLLADEEGTEWVYSANNKEIVGHRHAMDLCPQSAAELGPDHSAGIRMKCYHPKHARDSESDDDPLSSPKFGVAFHKSIDGSGRKWRNREDISRELEETLVNVLRWADIPAEPDPTCYVEDNHFEVQASDRDIADVADPTPRLEAEQESLLLSVLGELTPTAREATKVLATDGGGGVHYNDLAEMTGSSTSTIYRVLDQLGDAVKSDNGMVKFSSEKIRQEVVGMVDRLDDIVDDTAARLAELANVDLRSRAGSALEKWMAKYGAEFVDRDGGTIRFDTVLSTFKRSSQPTIEDVLEEGLEAWTRCGRDGQTFLELRFEIKDVVGSGYRGGSRDRGRVASIIGR